MKDFSERQLRAGCPNMEPRDTIAFCLECRFNDTKHKITDCVTDRFTYEELIGALLQAKEIIRNVGEE